MNYKDTIASLGAAALMLATGCSVNLTTPPERAEYDPAELEALECVPNLDQKIDESELQAALGVPISYLVNPAGSRAPVDLRGEVREADDGTTARRWDLSRGAGSAQVARIEASSIEGRWYASSFPTADFVAPADPAGRTENILRKDEDGLYLLGVASSEEAPAEGKTLLVYETEVPLYLFPLEVGDEWRAEGVSSNSTLRGLPYAGRDTYSVKVEAIGELALPDFTFEQVFMIRTKVTLQPAVGQSVSQQQVSFLFECFGEVARVTSLADEDLEFFEVASEIRRLGIE